MSYDSFKLQIEDGSGLGMVWITAQKQNGVSFKGAGATRQQAIDSMVEQLKAMYGEDVEIHYPDEDE